MRLRRRKSRTTQVADVLTAYLKPKAASKAAKGARKAAKGNAVYQVAKRTPVVRSVPIVAGMGVAAAVAARKLRGSGGPQGGAPAAA
jgi:IS4 transposase